MVNICTSSQAEKGYVYGLYVEIIKVTMIVYGAYI